MKTNSFYIIVAALVLLITSCNDDASMLTIINEDGTCSREMSFHPYPKSVMAPLDEPIENDGLHFNSDWERTWSVVGDSTRHACPMTEAQWDSLRKVFPKQDVRSHILMHTKRHFKSVGEMSDSLTKVVNHLFKATASLDKHFKWFYTDYVYTETYAINDMQQLFTIPLDKFVSADTASYWFTGQPNLAEELTGSEQKELLDGIESKISKWMNANTFDYIYTYIANVFWKDIKNPPVSKEEFLVNKNGIIMSPAVENMKIFDEPEQVAKILKDYYHTDSFEPIFGEDHHWDRILDHQYKSLQYLMWMKPQLNLVMPGSVIDGGMGKVDGNVIRYSFSGERLLPHEYVISATSRVTHVWAYVATLLVILLAIGSFVYERRK